MSTQPEALRLADECVESANCWANKIDTRLKAAAELRRLHAVNQELLAALKTLVEHFEYYMGDNECRPLENARAAIEKVEAL